MDAIKATAGTLSYWLRRQEIAAENIAHVAGTAFKAVHAAAHDPGAGHPESAEWTDWSQGSLKETDRPFDLALEGPGFLVVATPRGDRLTRGGSFQLDPGGLLVDPAGHALQGVAGPIHVTGNSFQVKPGGEVLVDGEPVAHLRLVSVSDPATLVPEGGDLFTTSAPATPAPEGSVAVKQGQVETANVDPVLSMIDMISIQRAYAANIQTLKTMDRVLEVAAGQVGDA